MKDLAEMSVAEIEAEIHDIDSLPEGDAHPDTLDRREDLVREWKRRDAWSK